MGGKPGESGKWKAGSGRNRKRENSCFVSLVVGFLLMLVAVLSGGTSSSVAWADDDDDILGTRRQHIEQMTEAEKEQLRRRQEQFLALKPEEQQRLRDLHHRLHEHPKAHDLQDVMQRYYHWLSFLPPYQREELLDLPPEERIKKIRQLLDAQRRMRDKYPNPKDIEGLLRWMQRYVERNEERLLQAIPAPHRERIAKEDPASRQRILLWGLWLRSHKGRPSFRLTETDRKELLDAISEETRRRLADRPADEQDRLLLIWMRNALRGPWSGREKHPMPPSEQEQLDDFVEHQLKPEEQDRLLSLPPDEMQRELLRLFYSHLRLPGGPDREMERPSDWPQGPPGGPGAGFPGAGFPGAGGRGEGRRFGPPEDDRPNDAQPQGIRPDGRHSGQRRQRPRDGQPDTP